MSGFKGAGPNHPAPIVEMLEPRHAIIAAEQAHDAAECCRRKGCCGQASDGDKRGDFHLTVVVYDGFTENAERQQEEHRRDNLQSPLSGARLRAKPQ